MGARAARRAGQWLRGPRGPAALGGARLTAPPPPASADWRPERPGSRRGLAEDRSGVGRQAWPNPHTLQVQAPARSPSVRATLQGQAAASSTTSARAPPSVPLILPAPAGITPNEALKERRNDASWALCSPAAPAQWATLCVLPAAGCMNVNRACQIQEVCACLCCGREELRLKSCV